jgi:hypothetical protein
MWPTTAARVGFDLTYKIFYQNVRTDTVANGQVLFKRDSRLTFLSSVPTISSSSGDTLKWNFSSFKPLDTATITVNMHVPSAPTVNIGDTLTSLALIIPIAGDQTPSDDSSIVKQIAIGAFDPNDKYEDNEGKITSAFMSSSRYLNYLVRFQNVGTDTAFNITIKDTLDTKLDLTTLQMITASHSYSLSISGRVLTWTFYNIQLPYSSINSEGSKGFIRFRIKPNSNLLPGDTIHNTASIYFDFNLPVRTNDAYTVLQDLTSPLPLNFLSFTGLYQNNHGILNWSTSNEINVASFRIERSSDGNITVWLEVA